MTLPRGWVEVRFDEITPPDAPIIYGILQPGPNLPEGVPYVRPTEIVAGAIDTANIRRTSPKIADQYRRASLRTGDTILSIVGTIGKVAETPIELDGGNITQSSCRIRHDDILLSGSQITVSGESDLVKAIRESTQQNVSRAGDQLTSRNLNIQPTITIRPGATVRLVVHKDLILAPWRG